MVQAATKLGNGQFLLPKGIDKVEDVPWDLAQAIQHAARISGWQENCLTEDMPPDWMWPFEDELELWFEEVRRRHAPEEELNDDNSWQNEYADRFK